MSSWSWLLRVLVVLVVSAWPVGALASQSRSDVFGRRLDDYRTLLWYIGSDPEAVVRDASGPRPVMRLPDERFLELEDPASAESPSSFVFGQWTSHHPGSRPDAVAVGDVTGDGREDVVVLHAGWMQAGVYLQGPGGLGPEQLFQIPCASHCSTQGFDPGDISSDSCTDLVIADHASGLVVLLGSGCV